MRKLSDDTVLSIVIIVCMTAFLIVLALKS